MNTSCLSLWRVLVLVGTLAGAARAAETDPALRALMQYQSGADATPLRQFEARVRQAVDDPGQRAALETDLLQVLRGEATPEARRFACLQLAVIGGEASVPALAALLRSEETAGIAAAALAQNPAPAASDALRRALGNAPAAARPAIAHALGVRRDTRAVAQLNRLALGEDRAAGEAAITALGQVGTAGAQKTLAALRRSAPPEQQRVVAAASLNLADTLARKGSRKAATAIYQDYLAADQPADLRRGAFGGLLRLDRDGGQKRAIEALRGDDAALKPVAIAALPELKNAAASRAFAAVLPNLAPAEQAYLLQALTTRGDAPARKAAQDQLNSPHLEVRLAAIAALGRLGDTSTVPALARAAALTTNVVELRAVETALAGLPGDEAVDRALAAQLGTRAAAAKGPLLGALVRRARPVSYEVFLRESASPDAAIARLAFQGLSRVAGPEHLFPMLRALRDLRAEAALEDAQAAVGQALRRMEPKGQGVLTLTTLLDASPPARRARLIPPLVFCPEPAVFLGRVADAARSSDPTLRNVGLRTLADWPDPDAWEPLKALYPTAASETERVLVLRGLTRLLGEMNARPDAALVGRYRELLGSAKGDNDRKLILGALAGCAHPEALALAVEQLNQPGVRAEAVMAVKKIAGAIKGQHPQAAEAALQKVP